MCLCVTCLSLMGRKSADGKKCREEVLGRAVSHLMGKPRERFTLGGCSWVASGWRRTGRDSGQELAKGKGSSRQARAI